MSDQSQTPESIVRIESLLQEVRKYAFSPKEMTIFSVEGIIGHDENRTSDLLCFFLDPDEDHGLGPLFLWAFFACLKIDRRDILFEDVKARTRDMTSDGKFPDFLIFGRDWLLIIENKIGAQNPNPLDSYEKYAEEYFPSKSPHFAILSKDGRESRKFPNWKAISYTDYCDTLKCEFAKAVFNRPLTKWQVFAREFILQLENTLSNTAMALTPEQTTFVEAKLKDIADLKMLTDCYTKELLDELSETVQKAFPGIGYQFYDFKGYRLQSILTSIGGLSLHFAFWTPAHEGGNPKREFMIKAWVKSLTDVQRALSADLFARTPPSYEGGGYWVGECCFTNRSEAIRALSDLAKELFDCWGNEPPNSPAPEAAV